MNLWNKLVKEVSIVFVGICWMEGIAEHGFGKVLQQAAQIMNWPFCEQYALESSCNKVVAGFVI